MPPELRPKCVKRGNNHLQPLAFYLITKCLVSKHHSQHTHTKAVTSNNANAKYIAQMGLFKAMQTLPLSYADAET